jgi:hypothetical protein
MKATDTIALKVTTQEVNVLHVIFKHGEPFYHLHVDRRCPWSCNRGALIRHDDHVTQDPQRYTGNRSGNALIRRPQRPQWHRN